MLEKRVTGWTVIWKEGFMEWKTSWSYLPLNFDTTIGSLENITQRTTFWNNVNGEKVKVKFSNKYGTTPLKLKEAVIAQKEKDSSQIVKHTNLTVNQKEEILILPGQEFYSDEVEFEVSAGTDIVLSIYYEERNEIQSCCCVWAKESWHTEYLTGGNYTRKEKVETQKSFEVCPFIGTYMDQADILAGISEIRLLTENEVKTITLFGDSITHMSFYADSLMEVLYHRFPGKVTILNKGIGGNKILTDSSFILEIPGHGRCSGDAGLKRFEKDVFETEIPEYVFVLEGVNDIMHPYFLKRMDTLPKAQDLIAAYIAMADIAHQKGSNIYFSTILPLKHEKTPFGPEGEQIRIEVNEWLLAQKESEGVFDFAGAVAKDKESMKEHLHTGDGLHPNKKGGTVMAPVVFQNGGIDNGIITD